jgi:hypothetical protein
MRLNLFLYLATGQLVTSMEADAPITALEAKRGAASPILLRLYESVFPGDPDEIEIQLAVKEDGKYDAALAASADAWTFDGAAQGYVATISWLTTAIDTLFAVDSNPDNDKASITLMLELAWRPTSTADWQRSQTVRLTVRNNVFRGSETATALVPPLTLALNDDDSAIIVSKNGVPIKQIALDALPE